MLKDKAKIKVKTEITNVYNHNNVIITIIIG